MWSQARLAVPMQASRSGSAAGRRERRGRVAHAGIIGTNDPMAATVMNPRRVTCMDGLL